MAAPKLRNKYVTLINAYSTVEVVGQDPHHKDYWIVVDEAGREHSKHYTELQPTLVKTRASARSGTYPKAR